MHLLRQEIWADIQKHTVGKRLTREGSRCKYASSHIGNFRTHLKEHTGERQNKCNQCEYASIQASHLRIQMPSVQLCILSDSPFKNAFQDTHESNVTIDATFPSAARASKKKCKTKKLNFRQSWLIYYSIIQYFEIPTLPLINQLITKSFSAFYLLSVECFQFFLHFLFFLVPL